MDNKAHEKYQAQHPVQMPVRTEVEEPNRQLNNIEIGIAIGLGVLMVYAFWKLFRKKT